MRQMEDRPVIAKREEQAFIPELCLRVEELQRVAMQVQQKADGTYNKLFGSEPEVRGDEPERPIHTPLDSILWEMKELHRTMCQTRDTLEALDERLVGE